MKKENRYEVKLITKYLRETYSIKEDIIELFKVNINELIEVWNKLTSIIELIIDIISSMLFLLVFPFYLCVYSIGKRFKLFRTKQLVRKIGIYKYIKKVIKNHDTIY